MGRSLLFEIGTEEIPHSFIAPALQFMEKWISDRFMSVNLEYQDIEVFGTPRRLAIKVSKVADSLPDTIDTRMGPAKAVSFDDQGVPTKAALGFARSAGVDIADVSIKETPKGEYLCVTKTIPGRTSEDYIPNVLQEMISKIPFSKSMRWSNPGVRFARPVHWIVALFGEEKLPVRFGDVKAGSTTYGNRFMSNCPLEITNPDVYEDLLEAHYVIPRIEKRMDIIWDTITRKAFSLKAQVKDKDLLKEVANLLEYPHVIEGVYDEGFLELPKEVLVTVMKHHQRFFPMYDLENEDVLRPYFFGVSNIIPKEDSVVRTGYERVLRARLEDAKYFFVEDSRVPLEDYAERLKDVIFHKDLGTSFEKVERFSHTALYLAEYLATGKKDIVKQAAYLSKADLNSLMVYELPELQGIMGREYALRQGYDPEVAQAIYEHYLPSSAEDDLPVGIIGDLIGIADRIDTICGCFGIGMVPTGTSDPYALRRQTIAIENILLGKGYRLSISDLIDQAISLLSSRLKRPGPEVRNEVLSFFRSRFVGILQAREISGDVIDAVLPGFDDPVDTFMRAKAIMSVKHEKWFESLCTASKRVENIIKKSDVNVDISEELFEQDEEKDLYKTYKDMEQAFISYASKGEYSSALKLMAGLKGPIDVFFEKVLVMSESTAVRQNRICLLKTLVNLFDRIARFSRIST